jgi:predicted MPP superfamily phosphohydrolase
MTDEPRLRILHVSDVHFGAKDDFGEQGRITSALVRAVERHQLRPDVCIFSGDLAHSGERAQLERGQQWLQELVHACGAPDLFIVPGNHDVSRSAAKRTLLIRAGADHESFTDWRDAVASNLAHLNEFCEWHGQAASGLPLKSIWTSPLGFVRSDIKAGIRCRVIGMNSALLSCRDGESGNLVCDIRTLNRYLQRSNADPELIISIAHHPFSDLSEWNRREIERLLSQETGAHLFMHGHLHEQLGV